MQLNEEVDIQPNPAGVDVTLEQWKAGSSEPPHMHPGDDMTVVVEGEMSIQFYSREGETLAADGDALVLCSGETGYIPAHRIHSVQYVEDCKLVYVHSGVFGYQEVEGGSHG